MKTLTKQKKPKMTKEERRMKYTNLARERREKQFHRKKHMNTICYKCRQRGHTVSQCPLIGSEGCDHTTSITSTKNNEDGNANNDNQQPHKSICCYKCGKTDHSLKLCPHLTQEDKNTCKNGKFNYSKMKLPFATCFICHKVGHLSSQCPLNDHGIYVSNSSSSSHCNSSGADNSNKKKKGCKRCGGLDHLFIHCPNNKTDNRRKNDDDNTDYNAVGQNVDEFLEEEVDTPSNQNQSMTSKKKTTAQRKKRKTVQF